jgi:hypothetical protein
MKKLTFKQMLENFLDSYCMHNCKLRSKIDNKCYFEKVHFETIQCPLENIHYYIEKLPNKHCIRKAYLKTKADMLIEDDEYGRTTAKK